MYRVNSAIIVMLSVFCCVSSLCAEGLIDLSPRPDEKQLPKAMHSAMSVRPEITVGRKDKTP